MKTFASPFLMAPMAGVTDEAFRGRLRANGARGLFTEMVSAAALVRNHRATLAMVAPGDQEPDLALQLFGAKPDEMGSAGAILADRGWTRVDINMGCPVKKVVQTGSGSALLRTPLLAGAIVRSVRRAFGGVLTVKIRTGWSEADRNYLEMGRILEQEGADGITLHGRTRVQGYSGKADWEAIYELAQSLKIPMAGNGDISSSAQALKKLEKGRLSAVMIGRAALGAPWIFRECEWLSGGLTPPPPPSAWVVATDIMEQFRALKNSKGSRVAVSEIKKFVAWADKGNSGCAERRNAIMRIISPVEMEERIGAMANGFPLTDALGFAENSP